ncbi:DVU3141 family protein [Aliamphritea ceti]|uniref:DVU3141 family protein n=1 Tax=Aliamphritea ceti TaxID=1524258 RepID=UPI0021C35260|nr:DVU3141 family protein [Aliamphritea ceti]
MFSDEAPLLNADADNILPIDVSEILTTTSQDMSIVISSGSMEGQTLIVGPTYFAASGRFCRKADIDDNLQGERYVACRSESGHWVLTRATI